MRAVFNYPCSVLKIRVFVTVVYNLFVVCFDGSLYISGRTQFDDRFRRSAREPEPFDQWAVLRHSH